jgi:translation initiation factor IF-3
LSEHGAPGAPCGPGGVTGPRPARCAGAPAVPEEPCRPPVRSHELEEETAIATLKEVRVNDRIRIPVVRVIGPDGEQVGILGIREALAYAQERQLDLVEVSPTAHPPVCRVMDFGKYKYEQSKKAQKARRKQHVMHLKEVKLRPKIEEHDFNFKVAHGREFLEAHDKVKFTVMFRGREMAHSQTGYRLLERVVKDLEEVGQVEIPPRMEGRNLVLLMIPRTTAKPPVGKPPAAKPASRAAAPARSDARKS